MDEVGSVIRVSKFSLVVEKVVFKDVDVVAQSGIVVFVK